MKRVANFISVLVILLIVFSFIFPSLQYRLKSINRSITARETIAVQAHGKVPKGTLDKTTGEDVLGMVLNALNGEYTLIVDGITIDQSTDMETVNVRGVVSRSYSLQVQRDSYGNVTRVVANVS